MYNMVYKAQTEVKDHVGPMLRNDNFRKRKKGKAPYRLEQNISESLLQYIISMNIFVLHLLYRSCPPKGLFSLKLLLATSRKGVEMGFKWGDHIIYATFPRLTIVGGVANAQWKKDGAAAWAWIGSNRNKNLKKP